MQTASDDVKPTSPRMLFSRRRQPPVQEVETACDISAPVDVKRNTHLSFRAESGILSGSSHLIGEHDHLALFFGSSLTSQPRETLDPYPDRIPSMLILLARHMVENGTITTPGIFRVSPEIQIVRRAREQLNHGLGIKEALMNIRMVETQHYTVCELLKDWFRSLEPNCLLKPLTTSAMREVSASSTPESTWRRLLKALNEPSQVAVFMWLMDFLAFVSSHDKDNLMTTSCLVRVFTPSLWYHPKSAESKQVLEEVIDIVQRCLDYARSSRVDVWSGLYHLSTRDKLKARFRHLGESSSWISNRS